MPHTTTPLPLRMISDGLYFSSPALDSACQRLHPANHPTAQKPSHHSSLFPSAASTVDFKISAMVVFSHRSHPVTQPTLPFQPLTTAPNCNFYTVFTESAHRDEDLLCFFDPVCEFVEKSLPQGNVLVGDAEDSRSSTLAIAYLMKARQWSLAAAYHWVVGDLDAVAPGESFLKQLAQYSQSMGHLLIPHSPQLEASNCRSEEIRSPWKTIAHGHDQETKKDGSAYNEEWEWEWQAIDANNDSKLEFTSGPESPLFVCE